MNYDIFVARLRRSEAQKNANAQARYAAPSLPRNAVHEEVSDATFARQCSDAEHVKLGLCVHSKIPRLVAERMAKTLGVPVKHCGKCA